MPCEAICPTKAEPDRFEKLYSRWCHLAKVREQYCDCLKLYAMDIACSATASLPRCRSSLHCRNAASTYLARLPNVMSRQPSPSQAICYYLDRDVAHQSNLYPRTTSPSSSGTTTSQSYGAFGIEPEDTCTRWCKKDKERKQVARLAVIAAYNKSMGGVDMCDRMIVYHHIASRTRRWNLRVIFHLVYLALSNCWLEWKQDGHSGMQLYDFLIAIATVLINAAEESDDDIQRLRKRNAIIVLRADVFRTSSASHLAVWEDMKKSARCRCERCRFKTHIKCTKRGVFLCTTSSGRNCFMDFHV